MPDRHEDKQARVGAGASRRLDAVEASPTPPSPYEPTAAEQVTLDKQAQRQKDSPVTPPSSPREPTADLKALLDKHAQWAKDTPVAAPPPPYEPTAAERAALDKQAQRQKDSPAAPRLHVTEDYRGIRYDLDHPDATIGLSLLMEAFGTDDPDFCRHLLLQLGWITNPEADEAKLNFPLAVIKGIKPKDQLQAMLGAHIAAMHEATMLAASELPIIQKTFSRWISQRGRTIEERRYLRQERKELLAEYLSLMDSVQRAIKGCARTFCIQIETLKRYRSNSEPSTTVQQVNVAQGAQAIVGNVTHAAPPPSQNDRADPQQVLTHQPRSAMPIIDNSGRKEKEEVSLRRKT